MSKAGNRKAWTLADLQALPGVRERNPHLFTTGLPPETRVNLPTPPPAPSEAPKGIRTAPEPKTGPEKAMARLLDARKTRGEVDRWSFEGLTLQIGGTRYTPDFCVWETDGTFVLIEVKGPFIREDGLIKWKLFAGSYPPGWCRWEFWQLTKEGWTRKG